MIWGYDNFRNEIVWHYRTGGISTKWFGRKHDIILSYVKDNKLAFFNPLKEKAYIPTLKGRTFALDKLKAQIDNDGCEVCGQKGGFYHMGSMTDVWDIQSLFRNNKERLGYPTQKPLELLSRIIKASSNEGDLVLDPFCGCGTTIDAAQSLNRKWIGIDVTWLAIDLIDKRLKSAYKDKVKGSYEIKGKPTDLVSARALANKSKKEFEIWAISLVGAHPREHDGGVDGIFGFTEKDKKTRIIIVQVKGGDTVNPEMIRALKGTVENEKAAIGLFITLVEPTSGMRDLAIHSPHYKSELWDKEYPSIQIRTIAELLDSKGFDLPPTIDPFKKAQTIRESASQLEL
jgi:site-specific DNA-methyltransferase (adenine-specific)